MGGAELKQSQENLPPKFPASDSCPGREIWVARGNTAPVWLHKCLWSYFRNGVPPSSQSLIVCSYKHKLLCMIEAPDFLVLLCKWNKIRVSKTMLPFFQGCYFFIGLDNPSSLLLKSSSHKHLCSWCKFILVCFFLFAALPLSCLNF